MTKLKESATVGWQFDNSYERLPQMLFSRIAPTPVRSPELVILNEQLAASLGLNAEMLQQPEGVAVLAGNHLPSGASPLAQAYAGHQFGHFTMLGDGRAVLLGEQITPQGERFDLQFKGSGPTPYSRRGDGRAALGPMLREYIISEAMHGLGIPTTRSLAVVSTGEAVIRESALPGAILTRVAASHLRVGTFEYVATLRDDELLRTLADYALQRHFSEGADMENRYLHLLREVVRRQAKLIAQWQLVGFVHGVMNTDNMTISGETIDYGPCAFMDEYDPATVFSSIDHGGRYAYGNQPYIGAWNLTRLANTLLPLFHEDQDKAVQLAQDVLSEYVTRYDDHWIAGMRAKLGLFNEEDDDEALVKSLLGIMHEHRVDYTNTFLALTFGNIDQTVLNDVSEFSEWYARWKHRLERQAKGEDLAHDLMRNNNPALIPRNHRVEEALSAAEQGDFRVMHQLQQALANPYAHTKEQARYAQLPTNLSSDYITFCGT